MIIDTNGFSMIASGIGPVYTRNRSEQTDIAVGVIKLRYMPHYPRLQPDSVMLFWIAADSNAIASIRSRHSSGTEIVTDALVICVGQDSSRPTPGRSLCLMCGCVVVVCPPGRKGKSEEQSQWLLPRSQRLSSVGAKRSVGC